MVGFCEEGNEPLGSTAAQHVFTNYHRLKEDKTQHQYMLASFLTRLSTLFSMFPMHE